MRRSFLILAIFFVATVSRADVVTLKDGRRLEGVWGLIPAKLDGKEENWLLVRKREQPKPRYSVAQGRYRPMLATLESPEKIPKGPEWSFEIKWDGYRAVAYVRGVARERDGRRGRAAVRLHVGGQTTTAVV